MFYLILASIIWSFSFGLIKHYLVGVDSAAITVIRLGIAFFVFLPFVRLQRKVLLLIALGAVQYGLMYLFYFESFKYLKAFEVALFTLTTPFFVVFANALIRKKVLSKSVLVCAFLAVLGAVIIAYKDLESENYLWGVLLVQISNMAFAAGQVIYSDFKGTMRQHAGRLGWMYLGGFLLGIIARVYEKQAAIIPSLAIQQWLVVIFLGVVASGIGFYLWNLGATKVSGAILAVLNNLKIPLAVFVALVIFSETANLVRLFIGSVLLLGGVVVAELKAKQ